MTLDAPIGVFDSGAGGLSVLREIHALLPAESLIYVADSAHAPYGSLSSAALVDRAQAVMTFLRTQNIKALVVACNTATAAAVTALRESWALPIIAMEPGIKPAAELSRSGIIGVLATEGTSRSERYLDLKSRFAGQVEIITVPCPGLVESIERGAVGRAERQVLLERFIEPLKERGVDSLILGCTHYSLVKDEISAVAGPAVSLLDTGPAVARHLKYRLQEEGLLREAGAPARLRFYSSSESPQQAELLSHYWQRPVEVSCF